MPLVRFLVRNEYGLGDPELYKCATKREDPKALLDGVAVAGLVGILRQLGDLAEFAAEIFHDLHEQVTVTAARGHRMMTRIHRLEEALPAMEKAVQNQKSHIHFAYVPGCEWHPNIHIECDHLRHSDLPRFVMDLYEEGRDPPRLSLLDKFDSAGPGSGVCLRRYSDPTYFKRVCTSLEPLKTDKVPKARKIHKNKKKIARMKNGDIQHVISLSHRSRSLPCTSPGTDGQSIATETLSTSDVRLKSDIGSRSTSFDSRARHSFVEPTLEKASSIDTENLNYDVSSSSMIKDSHGHVCATGTASDGNAQNLDTDDDFYNSYLETQSLGSPSTAWNEKPEIVKPMPKSRFLIDSVDVNYPQPSEQPECSKVPSELNGNYANVNDSENLKSNIETSDVVDDDGSHHNCMVEQQNFSSSSITWDEKEEIVKYTETAVPYPDLVAAVEGSVTHSYIHEACKEDAEIFIPGDIDKGEVVCAVTNIQAQFPANHFEEVSSEAENYVDAPNTLESETETDSEFQTKRELMPPPKSNSQGIEPRNDNLTNSRVSSLVSSDTEISVISHSSLNKDEPAFLSTNSYSGSIASTQLHDGLSGCSVDNEQDKFTNYTPEFSTAEAVAPYTDAVGPPCNSTFGDLQELPATETKTTEMLELELPQVCDKPIKIWTNGGLLGLEPSKPPHFSIPNTLQENSVSESHATNDDILNVELDKLFLNPGTAGLSAESKPLARGVCSEVLGAGSGNMVYPTESSSSFSHNEERNGRLLSKSHEYVPALLKPEFVKSQEAQPSGVMANGAENDLTKAISHSGNESLITLNGDTSSSQLGPLKMGVSSTLTSLTKKLLMNSLQRKESLLQLDTSATASPSIMYPDSRNLENISIPNVEANGHNRTLSQEILGSKTMEKAEFSLAGDIIPSVGHCSGQLSPPLEHMKISFHPMNGLETNKLKLEFPDGHLHENVEDLMFPSFQLLPGPNIHGQDACSESDDDTFCRSYSYSQEDVYSHSDSDSELWEQDEMSETEEHRVHDGSRRFSSSTASVSGSLVNEGIKHIGKNQVSALNKSEKTNGISAFPLEPFLDLPNLDSFNPSLTQQKVCSVPNNTIGSTMSSSTGQPPLPPLPPLQWRTLRNPVPADNNELSSNDVKLSDGLQFTSHSPEKMPRPPCNGETVPIKNKLSELEELSQASKIGEHDEREDLLHQIRNKTFNLRPTLTSRPSHVPRSTTNVKVAAILEKAKALRQAFASSDEGGDEETWSDG